MIGWLRGQVVAVLDSEILVADGGTGYRLTVPAALQLRLQEGEELTLFVHTHVREDALDLYGFETRDQLEAFEMLIAVSGVGPKAGLGIVGTLSAGELEEAILAGDDKEISRAPGVGSSLAKKVILQLQPRLAKKAGPLAKTKAVKLVETPARKAGGELRTQVEDGLRQLGMSPRDIDSVLDGIEWEGKSAQDVIQEAFKIIRQQKRGAA